MKPAKQSALTLSLYQTPLLQHHLDSEAELEAEDRAAAVERHRPERVPREKCNFSFPLRKALANLLHRKARESH